MIRTGIIIVRGIWGCSTPCSFIQIPSFLYLCILAETRWKQSKPCEGLLCTWLSDGFLVLLSEYLALCICSTTSPISLPETRCSVTKIFSCFKVAHKPWRQGSCFSSLHLVHLSLEYTYCLEWNGNSSPDSVVSQYWKWAAVKIKCYKSSACCNFHQGQDSHTQQIWSFLQGG